MTRFLILPISLATVLLGYSCIGTSGRVDAIKQRAPSEMPSRNWKIVRYEGYQFGSWSEHGGKVWYHVSNLDNPSIQYRVYITLWGGELHYVYGAPETLNRVELDLSKPKAVTP